jgi:hypothetical protein
MKLLLNTQQDDSPDNSNYVVLSLLQRMRGALEECVKVGAPIAVFLGKKTAVLKILTSFEKAFLFLNSFLFSLFTLQHTFSR